MKTKVCVVLCAILLLMAVPAGVGAAQWGLGLTSLYSAWEPAWRNHYENIEDDPYLAIGLVGTVTFLENCNITLVILAPNAHPVVVDSGTGNLGDYTNRMRVSVKRSDIDAIFSYRIFEGFSIFAGFKFLRYKLAIDRYIMTYNSSEYSSGAMPSMENSAMGGGLGFSYSHPLIAQRLYVIYNASFVYLNAEAQLVNTNPDLPFSPLEKGPTAEYRTYGFNTTLSFSYYIEPLSTAIVIGGRYQYLYYKAVDEDPYNMSSDIMYGVTASAIFYF